VTTRFHNLYISTQDDHRAGFVCLYAFVLGAVVLYAFVSHLLKECGIKTWGRNQEIHLWFRE
jgi:hypothetical protein